MKTKFLYNAILVVLLCVTFFSCKKEDAGPAYDISLKDTSPGVWPIIQIETAQAPDA